MPRKTKAKVPAARIVLPAVVESSDDAIVTKDLTGIVTSWNKAAERIFGYSAAEMTGQSITRIIPEERLPEEEHILSRIRRGERIDHFETVRCRKDGTRIDISVTISPIRDGAGQIVGATKVARDITDQRRRERESRLLAAIVSSSEDAIVSKNLDGIITSWNASAQRMFGYTPEEAVGRSVLMLLPQDRKYEEVEILARLRRGERVEHFETIRVRKNGEHFPVSLTISPVRDETGRVIGASKIARDITELRRISAEREQLLESERSARAHAEHASRMKDDFLAVISHELRTPLNAIVGWTQILKESPGEVDSVRQGVGIIERNARIQAQLINDLLDLGRITSGKLILDVDWVDIGEVIDEAIASVRHAAEQKQIALKTFVAPEPGAIKGDKKRLQQVIWNLVSNSIKFTPKRGKIFVSLTRINSHVEITVADNGQGISADFLPHVFEQFRQADTATTRQHGGLGIGLALVKQLVEMHGGAVHAESPGEGKGATFTVTLPIAVSRLTVSAPPAEPAPHGSEATGSEDLTGIKVLAIDDDADSLDVIKRILHSRHGEVETASTVEAGLRAFSAFRPTVILSDIGMPGQDGYDLIRRIRSLPGGANTPAAALTALARAEDRMRALRAGFQTHVAKPVAPAELIAVVRSLASVWSGD